MSTTAQYGIWGDTTPLERKRIGRAEGRPSVDRTLVVVQPLWQRDALQDDDALEDEELHDLLNNH